MDLGFLNGVYYIKAETMLNEDDFNALKRLQKSFFFRYLKTRDYAFGSAYTTLDNVIVTEKNNLKKELTNNLEDDFLVNVFYLKYDAINIKIVYKSIKHNLPISAYSKVSRFSVEALEQFFKYDNDKLIPNDAKEMFHMIKQIEIEDDQLYIQEVEKIIYESYENQILNKHKMYRPLHQYLQVEKAIINLKTLLKLKLNNDHIDKFKKAILNESIIGYSNLVSLYEGSLNDISNRIYIYFNEKISDATNDFLKTEDSQKINDALIEYQLNNLKELSYLDNTVGPILYYLFLKEIEMNKIRGYYYDK